MECCYIRVWHLALNENHGFIMIWTIAIHLFPNCCIFVLTDFLFFLKMQPWWYSLGWRWGNIAYWLPLVCYMNWSILVDYHFYASCDLVMPWQLLFPAFVVVNSALWTSKVPFNWHIRVLAASLLQLWTNTVWIWSSVSCEIIIQESLCMLLCALKFWDFLVLSSQQRRFCRIHGWFITSASAAINSLYSLMQVVRAIGPLFIAHCFFSSFLVSRWSLSLLPFCCFLFIFH